MLIFSSITGALEIVLIWIMVYSLVSKVCDTVKSCIFTKYCGVETIILKKEGLKDGD